MLDYQLEVVLSSSSTSSQSSETSGLGGQIGGKTVFEMAMQK